MINDSATILEEYDLDLQAVICISRANKEMLRKRLKSTSSKGQTLNYWCVGVIAFLFYFYSSIVLKNHFLFLIKILCMAILHSYMSVCALCPLCACPVRPEVRSSGTEIVDSCELPWDARNWPWVLFSSS